MSKYRTIDIWNQVYGTEQEAYDYAGRLMKKSACGKPNSSYHPTLDHIRPLSNGGCDVLENIVICHREYQRRKSRFVSTLDGKWKTLSCASRERLKSQIRNHRRLRKALCLIG